MVDIWVIWKEVDLLIIGIIKWDYFDVEVYIIVIMCEVDELMVV